MIPRYILIAIWLSLALTVPWWFFDLKTFWFGLPAWIVYAIFSAVIYSCVLGWVIQKYWQIKKDAN